MSRERPPGGPGAHRRPGLRVRLLGVGLGIGMGLAPVPGSPARAAEPYRVGPGDQLQVTVYGEQQLSGRFEVSPDGAISYPLVGSVPVAALSAAEIGDRLRALLARQVPGGGNLTVAIGQYASVFAMGDVQSPGPREFRPGMVVLELVALAGGQRQGTAAQAEASVRLLALRQEVRDLQLQRFSQGVERLRLAAEVSGGPFTAGLVEGDDTLPAEATRRIVEDEVALFEARQQSLAATRSALQAQVAAFDQEIATLRQSVGLHETEIGLIKREVDTQDSLVSRGLSTQPKLLDLQRELASAMRLSLDIRASLARAQQAQLDVAQKLAEAGRLRLNENSATLRTLDLELGRADQAIEAKRATIAELRLQADEQPVPARRGTAYTILRRVDGHYETEHVGELAELRPRDILKVSEAGEEVSTLP